MLSKKFKIFSFIFILASSLTYSHPHIFIETTLDVNFNRFGIDGFWVEWIFDPIYSATIIADFDLNRNRKFDSDEIAEVYENAFSGIAASYFFIFIDNGKRIIRPTAVSDFSARIEKNNVVYRFFTPFRSEALAREKEVTIGVYDLEFYCDIVFVEKEPIKLSNADYMEVDYILAQNEDKTIEYDNSFQTYQKKGRKYPGTANPYELNLRFKLK